MKINTPSPAMGVALTALMISLSGTAVAAVSYANNAGKVDGRDAVSSKSSNNTAAGKLVATAGAGPSKGKIPGKFLGGVAQSDSFARVADVQDNATDVATTVTTIPGLGQLTATCGDQNAKAGVEDPITRLTFANTSGAAVNFVRTVGQSEPTISVLPTNIGSDTNIGGSNIFSIWIQRNGTHYVLDGVVRQDGRNTATAQCLVYGYTSTIADAS